MTISECGSLLFLKSIKSTLHNRSKLQSIIGTVGESRWSCPIALLGQGRSGSKVTLVVRRVSHSGASMSCRINQGCSELISYSIMNNYKHHENYELLFKVASTKM